MVGHGQSNCSAFGFISKPIDPAHEVRAQSIAYRQTAFAMIIHSNELTVWRMGVRARSIWDKMNAALRDSPLAIEPLFGGACHSQSCVGVRVMDGACVCADNPKST